MAAVSEAAPCLGKRKREESESSDFGSDVEETSTDGSDIGEKPGMFESGDGVVMKLFADHTPVRSEKCAKRKKKKKLSKETKQLLRRQEVLNTEVAPFLQLPPFLVDPLIVVAAVLFHTGQCLP